jgi:acetyl esterase/lipase
VSPRRVAVGLAAVAALAAVVRAAAACHRAVAAVPAELRHPLLYLPLDITGGVTLALSRRLLAAGTAVRPGVEVTEHKVPASATELAVPVFAYQVPGRGSPGAAVLWIHGGGLVAGAARQGHAWCSRIAQELNVLVVSVEYRLAPEHPFPAGLDDCYHALRWLHENAGELGIDPGRIAVGGDSAGGGLAAALAQRARDAEIPVRFQLLIYPMLDDRTVLRTGSGTPGVFTWTPASNRFAWTAYLGHPPEEADGRPYTAAARCPCLGGLPAAWIGVGDLDLFHPEAVTYAHRLRAAGVPCDLVVIPGMYHGADGLLDGKVPALTAFRAAMLAALGDALALPGQC